MTETMTQSARLRSSFQAAIHRLEKAEVAHVDIMISIEGFEAASLHDNVEMQVQNVNRHLLATLTSKEYGHSRPERYTLDMLVRCISACL